MVAIHALQGLDIAIVLAFERKWSVFSSWVIITKLKSGSTWGSGLSTTHPHNVAKAYELKKKKKSFHLFKSICLSELLILEYTVLLNLNC